MGKYSSLQRELKRNLLRNAIHYQRNRCHLCNEPMASPKHLDDPLRATADHIIPYSLGGNLKGNIKAAHFKCNVERGNKLI